MASDKRKWKILVLGLGLSVLLPILAFQGVDISRSWEQVCGCLGWELALGGMFFLVTVAARSWRWQYLLAAQREVGLRSCLSATCVGGLANNVLPFRLGDLVRVGALRHLEGGCGARGLATIAVERILDILTLVFFLGAYLTFVAGGSHRDELYYAGRLALAGGVFLVLMLVAGYWRRDWVQRLAAAPWRWFSPAAGDKVAQLTGRFLEGLKVFVSLGQVNRVVLLSLALWGAAVLSYYFVGQAVGLDLPASAYMVVVFATAFGAIIPAAPGAVGTFHGFARLGLYLAAGVSGEMALAFAAVLHAAEWSLMNLAGLGFFVRDRCRHPSSPRIQGEGRGGTHATATPPQDRPQPAYHAQSA